MDIKSTSIISEADVVVIGGGAAGITAAYRLAKEGKKVILLEKAKSFLETNFSKISGFMGCETYFQKESGITIASKTNLHKELISWAGAGVNSKLLRVLLDNSAEAANTLQEMGLSFITYADITGDSKFINDIVWAPLHCIMQEGKERAELVYNALVSAGVNIINNCEGSEITMNKGRVSSIKGIINHSTPIEINTNAVFVATGGFGNNKDMLKYWFNNAQLCHMGSKYNTGDGIRISTSAGGVTEKYAGLSFNELCGGSVRHGNNPFDENWNIDNENLGFSLYGGLNVDAYGERFMNEALAAVSPLSFNGVASLSVGNYYVIMDGDYYEGCCKEGVYKYMGNPNWDYGRNLPYPILSKAKEELQNAIDEGWAVKADTLAEIADYFKLINLEDTVKEYNMFCKKGQDQQYGKDAMFLKEIKDDVGYYAFQYSGSFWCTVGGMKSDAHLHVLDKDNCPIPGLYIGGVEMGSAFGKTYYHIAASASGLAIASGNLAAKEIISYCSEIE